MNLAFLDNVRAPILIHLATVLPALVIGTWLIFLSTKGARPHRGFGALYLALMTATAATVYFIRPLSFLHLFVPVTLVSVFGALSSARAGNIASHRGFMLGLYFGGLFFAGALAVLLPGRLINRVVFG